MPSNFPAITVGSKSRKRKGFRVLRADFGDGYTQAVPDGINNEEEMWELSFDQYPIADVQTLESFFDSLGAADYFYWTPPYEATSKKWRQEGEYSVSFDGPLTKTMTVSIKRVFTL